MSGNVAGAVAAIWLPTKARLNIAGVRGRAVVDGFSSVSAPGLIIHPAPTGPPCWVVTHRSSGRSILPFCPDREYAELAAVTLCRAVDWKRPFTVIFADHKAKALAMSFAAALVAPRSLTESVQ